MFCGRRAAVAPRPGGHSLTFGWRAMLKIKHVPEQLFDVTMFPIMFTLMFTYLFGGALAGSTEAYLQFLIPGILVQTMVMITMYTGDGAEHRHPEGGVRQVPVTADLATGALVGALLADVLRYSIGSTIVITLGLVLGFRPEGGAVGWCSRSCCCWCSRSACRGCGRCSPDPAHAELGDGGQHDGAVSADVRQQRVRRPEDDAAGGCRSSSRSTRSRTWRPWYAA